MQISAYFLTHYHVLYNGYYSLIWNGLTYDQMRVQPHPKVNTIVWNLWHLARVEDSGINRFVADNRQVMDDEDWNTKVGLSTRYQGTGMSIEEMLDLSNSIDIDALKGYQDAIYQRTCAVVDSLPEDSLGEIVSDERLHAVLVQEELASPNAYWLTQIYSGWTKGLCLNHFGIAHHLEHIGKIATIASLMDENNLFLG